MFKNKATPDEAWPKESRWSSVLIPLLIGLASLVLLPLMTVTSLPLIGWGRGAWTQALSILPGFLVGWTSVSKRRLLPILATMIGYGLFSVPRMGYAGVIGLLLVPPVFLATVGLGIWMKSLTGGRAHSRPVLAVLCLSITSVILYLWLVDGWRFIYAETNRIEQVIRNDPVHFFYPSPSDYHFGLGEAAGRSLARGDRERARKILVRSERLALLWPKGSNPHEVARLEVEAGADKEAEAFLVRVEPDIEQRKLVFVDGYLGRRDVSRAMLIADGLSDAGKFAAYTRIAEREGRAGQLNLARDAVRELFRLAGSNCAAGTSAQCKQLTMPAGGDVYGRIAFTQANSGLFADAVATLRQHSVPDEIRELEGLAETALEMRRPDQARMIFARTRNIILTNPDARRRDDLLVELSWKQSADRLFDDAEETVALIQDAQNRETAAASIAHDRNTLKAIQRNIEDSRRSPTPKVR